jgi:peptidoglycan pentaglycine glycine transferase (the first glycine)
MAAMRKKTRQYIRLGAKNGIVVCLGTEDDLSTFHRLARKTGERKQFSAEPLDYYRHLWRALAPGDHLKLFLAQVDGETVSALMVIAFGSLVTSWRIGWSGSHAGYHPNEAVQWAAIKWAKEQGYAVYDLGGIGPRTAGLLQRGEPLPDTPEYRAYLFKIGFGGEVVVFPKASLYVYNPLLRRLYRAAWRGSASSSVMTKLMELLS